MSGLKVPCGEATCAICTNIGVESTLSIPISVQIHHGTLCHVTFNPDTGKSTGRFNKENHIYVAEI